jgi:hypothetical protein
LKARVTGDHKQVRKAGQLGDDVLDDSVRQIFLFWISVEIGERQDSNGGLRWQAVAPPYRK